MNEALSQHSRLPWRPIRRTAQIELDDVSGPEPALKSDASGLARDGTALPPFSMRQAFSVLLITTLVTQGLNAGLTLVQARLYAPAGLGELASVLSIAMIICPICTMQLPVAIPQQKTMVEVAELVTLVVVATTGMLFLLSICSGVYSLIAHPALRDINLVALGLSIVPFIVAYDMGRMLAAREGIFRGIGRQNVLLAVTRALVQLVGGFLGGIQIFLVIGEAIGRLGSLFAVRGSLLAAWRAARSTSLDLSGALRVNWRFPLVSLPSTLLDNLGGYLPPILLGGLYGIDAAGWYFLAQRIVSLPNILLAQTAADVFQVRAAQVARIGNVALRSFVLRSSIALLIVGLGFAGAMFGIVRFVWPWIFGLQWSPAQQMAYALLLPLLPQTVCGSISRILVVTNRQALKLSFDAVFLAVTLSPMLAQWFGLNAGPLTAVWRMGIGYLVAYFLYFGLIILAAHNPIKLNRSVETG